MQPRDEAALALYQANRRHPEIEALMDEFFGFTTKAEFERQLRCVEQEFPCVITGLPSPSHSSAHSLLEC